MSTQSYRHEEDHIAKFIDEKTILADGASVTRVAIFNAYRDWCGENGEKPITQNNLTRELKARLGIAESESAGFKMFIGVDLLQVNSGNNKANINDLLGEMREKDDYWK
jgi:phage/plasmid-associated DNA primase